MVVAVMLQRLWAAQQANSEVTEPQIGAAAGLPESAQLAESAKNNASRVVMDSRT